MSPILGARGGLSARAYGFTSAAAAVGDYESIQTVTTAAVNVTFSSIPSTYKHLQLRVLGKSSNATYSSIYYTVRFNGDTGSNYNCHSLYGAGASASAMYNGSYTDQMIAGELVASGGGVASQNSSPVVIDIVDYTSTNKYKTMRALAGFDGNGLGNIRLSSGLWMNTAAITSITIMGADTNISAALYGIKG
jgi:hypothetical protein